MSIQFELRIYKRNLLVFRATLATLSHAALTVKVLPLEDMFHFVTGEHLHIRSRLHWTPPPRVLSTRHARTETGGYLSDIFWPFRHQTLFIISEDGRSCQRRPRFSCPGCILPFDMIYIFQPYKILFYVNFV